MVVRILFFCLLVFQTSADALELICEFKVQGAYPFLSTTVPMVDENTLGDEVIVDRYYGAKVTYLLRPLSLTDAGELFKFAIADGSATEVYVTVFKDVAENSGSLRSQITNPEALDIIKNVPGLCLLNENGP